MIILSEVRQDAQPPRHATTFLSVLNNRLSWGASQLFLGLFGIGLNEWRILTALRAEPDIQALRVAALVGMNKSIVSRSARRLEQLDHLKTRVQKSRRLLSLTSAGEDLHDRIIVVALQREGALLEGFAPDECETLFTLLARMRENLTRVEALDRSLMVQSA